MHVIWLSLIRQVENNITCSSQLHTTAATFNGLFKQITNTAPTNQKVAFVHNKNLLLRANAADESIASLRSSPPLPFPPQPNMGREGEWKLQIAPNYN
jgi:hypothetical protein